METENALQKLSRPHVTDFVDYRAFLNAFWEWKREKGEFTYADFASRAGFKSRSYIRLVMMGKRQLTADSISKFIVGLNLTAPEAEAFATLVQFNQAGDFDSRKYYWEKLLKMRPAKVQAQIVRDSYTYLSKFAYPILLTLLRQDHVSQDLEHLSKMTGLKKSELEEGIRSLTNLGLIENDGVRLRATKHSFTTPNDVPNIAVQTFHRNMLEKAKEKLSESPQNREFQSLLLPLKRQDFETIQQRIRNFVQELRQEFGGGRPDSEKAYALNLNLIAVTPDFIRHETVTSQLSGQQQKNGEEK